MRIGKPFFRRGSWYVWIRDEWGERRQISTGAKTIEAARRWIAAYQDVPATTKGFREAFEEFLERRQIKDITKEEYRANMTRYAFPKLGDLQLHDVRAPAIEGVLDAVSAKGLAPRTRNLVLANIRTFFRWAVRMEYTLTDPTASVQMLRVPQKEVTFINEEQQERLLVSCRNGPDYLYALVLLALRTGLRRSNFISLRWAWIDLDERVLRLPASHAKGNRDFTIRLASDVVEALREAPRRKGCIHVFPHATSFEKVLRKYAVLAGLPAITPHWLRRTFITHLARKNIDIATIQRLAQHQQLSTTARYLGAAQRDMDEAITKVFG